MANIAVTMSGDSFNVDFGAYASSFNMKKSTFSKARVSFTLLFADAYVNVNVVGDADWALSFDGAAGTFQVDTVNGVAPTSNSDLYDKLIALL